jgi:hypothetical protein
VSSSWGDCLSGILPRRLDAEAGLRWLITVWLPVRVLPAPPRIPTLTEISRGLTNSPRFRGGVGPAYILCTEEGPLQKQFRVFCLWRPKTVSPEPEKARPETRFACDRFAMWMDRKECS